MLELSEVSAIVNFLNTTQRILQAPSTGAQGHQHLIRQRAVSSLELIHESALTIVPTFCPFSSWLLCCLVQSFLSVSVLLSTCVSDCSDFKCLFVYCLHACSFPPDRVHTKKELKLPKLKNRCSPNPKKCN